MAKELDWPPFPGITAAAMEHLLAHHWPGNVRELRNVVERSVARSTPDEAVAAVVADPFGSPYARAVPKGRSEEHTAELQSLMRTSEDVFCLQNTKKKQNTNQK